MLRDDKINYRVYGNMNKKGWYKIKEVEKKEYIQVVLDDMAESELFIGYIVIRHNFTKNYDEPYSMGDFKTANKIKRR